MNEKREERQTPEITVYYYDNRKIDCCEFTITKPEGVSYYEFEQVMEEIINDSNTDN